MLCKKKNPTPPLSHTPSPSPTCLQLQLRQLYSSYSTTGTAPGLQRHVRSVGHALASRVVVKARSCTVVLRMGRVVVSAVAPVAAAAVVVVVKAPGTGLHEHARQPFGSVSHSS